MRDIQFPKKHDCNNSSMKRFLTLLLVCVYGVSLHADNINPAEALDIAKQFVKQASGAQGRHRVSSPASSLKEACASDGYYIFNLGTDGGYVVVAADDAARSTILGYSFTGHFDPNDVPEGLQWWLEQYDEQVAQAAANNQYVSAPMLSEGAVVVEPLVTSTWNQDNPFNLYCTEAQEAIPSLTGSIPAGCMAIALAQIMRYHEWPVHGTGQKTYTYTYPNKNVDVTVSADFSQSTYDWANMRDNYGYNGYEYYFSDDGKLHYYSSRPLGVTEEEKEAVARLIKDVGVACEMTYKVGGSSAATSTSAIALYTYFGYKRSLAYRRRTSYSNRQWDDLLRAELDARRPVLYTGVNENNTGHAFVCDGYTSDGYFHFNWGWRGKSDGYFLTTALDPNATGTLEGESGYVYSQSIITGIEPYKGEGPQEGLTSLEVTFDGVTSTDAKNFSFISHVSLLEAETLKYYLFFQSLTTGNKYYKNVSSHAFTHDGLWKATDSNRSYVPAIDDGLYLVYPTYSREGNDNTRIRMKYEGTGEPALLVQIANGTRSIVTQTTVNGARISPQTNGEAVLLPDYYEEEVEIPSAVSINEDDYPVTSVAYGAFSDSYELERISLHRNLDLSKAKVPAETSVEMEIVDADRINWTTPATNYDHITYTRDFADYGTLVLPYAVSAEALTDAGLKVYTLSDQGLVFNEVSSMEAGKPYFYVDESYDGSAVVKTLTLDADTYEADASSAGNNEWQMTGTFVRFVESGNWGNNPIYYGLGDNYELKGAGRTISAWPYRAYFQRLSETQSNAISLRGNNGETTILHLDAEGAEDNCYDLQGRKVEHPSHGVYIVNGQKRMY